jgi:uncharacterized protein YeaO (DUF488 family)
MTVIIKRVYESPSRTDGFRVLVDRLWPRGLTKEAAVVHEWMRDIAPSNDLRRWYHSNENQWAVFRHKYLAELFRPECEQALGRLYELARERKRLTLLFGSKETVRNNASVLKELLDGVRKPPKGTGPATSRTSNSRRTAMRRR